WINREPESLLPFVWRNGKRVPLQWTLNPAASQSDTRMVRFVYNARPVSLRLTWIWQVRAGIGPIEHSILIQNLSHAEIWIPMQDSFQFSWHVAYGETLREMYIDKGAGKPTKIGTHEIDIPVGYQWQGMSSTYATDAAPREIIPWMMVEQPQTRSGWYAGIEFSGRTRITLQRDGESLRGEIGLNPEPGPFRTRLGPRETFEAPTVFLGAFTGGADGLGNVLRPWVRAVLMNPDSLKNPEFPMLVNNSWGSGMAVNETIAKRMIRDSAELGLEMFHLDAGWFRGVGDWYPDPQKFPNGLAVISDYAHAYGLKFGLWVNWAEAGVDTNPGALNVFNPGTRDWLVADVPPNWNPDPFVGRTIDLGVPAVHDYAAREVQRIVRDDRLDMLEHDGYVVAKSCVRTDHPHAAGSYASTVLKEVSGVDLPIRASSTDVSYHSVRSYYDIYCQLRRTHPDLLLEICDNGGRMVDFGSAAHGDYFSITDSYDPLSNRQAFYDASHVLPAAMLEDYEMKWPTPRIENFLYMLRSGMMGWTTIMQDTTAWTAQQHSAAKEEFATYKKRLRPLIRNADLYHISPRPDGIHWDGMEYFNSSDGQGVVYAFRGSAAAENSHTFHLGGLSAAKRYHLQFHDHSGPDRTISGRELMQKGLTVNLSVPITSEMIFLHEESN
ncbi:MAG TPA: glycoside hydrolase family 36 protein, partial [Acidobacteriaceae bacterium]|nr:glycoside hydrolase family 36 protein [Acidobacteriaceae bacterium]